MKKTLIGIVTAICAAVAATNLNAVSDDNWVGMGGLPGVSGTVYAAAWHNGAFYAGGDFTIAGDVFADRIAKWDGKKWSALGTGLRETVYALVGDNTENLYAASGKNVLKWDGKKWTVLGRTNGSAGSLALDGSGNLYAGGFFTKMGGVSANHIAKWDGVAWSALGQGVDGHVRALAVTADNTLYVGGYFKEAEGGKKVVNGVAKWDGKSWAALGGGLPNYRVYTLAFDRDGCLYVGGGSISDKEVGSVQKWDGSRWTVEYTFTKAFETEIRLTNDVDGNLYAAYDDYSVYSAYGECEIRKKIGNKWVSLVSYISGSAKALACDDSGNFYVGGVFSGIDGDTFLYVAKWNGKAWQTLGDGLRKTGCDIDDSKIPYVYALVADAVGNIYMGGCFNEVGTIKANHIAKWNGSEWTALGAGVDGYVNALALDAAGNLYAGGGFTAAGGVSASRIAKWDGAAWSALGAGVRRNDEYTPHVDAIAMDNVGNIYVGGWFQTAGDIPANHIAKWNGSTWSALGNGAGAVGSIDCLARDASGGLYAGGHIEITAGSGNYVRAVAKWDGSAWRTVGEWFDDGSVNALTFNAAGTLFASGFDSQTSVVAKYDDAKWTVIGKTEKNAGIYALAFDARDNLYVGGAFSKCDNQDCENIAKWDGKKWAPLGAGIKGNAPCALAFDAADDLYVGGHFLGAGDKVSFRLAKCIDPGKPNPETVTVTFAAGENGSIDNPGAQTVKFDGNCNPVKAIPNAGCLFSYWKLGEKTYSTANPLTVKKAQSDMVLTAVFALVPVGLRAANMTSTYTETIKCVSYPGSEGEPGYTERSVQSRDKYGFKCVIQMNAGWENLAEGDTVQVTAGDFSQTFALSKVSTDEEIADYKLGGAKGGSASWTYKEFVETNEETGAGYYATVLKTTLKWTAKGVMTLTVAGSPVPDEDANILNLSGSSLGPVFGELDCEVLFGNLANMAFQIPYSGKRSEKIAKWSEEGEPVEQELASWNVKGTLKIPKK